MLPQWGMLAFLVSFNGVLSLPAQAPLQAPATKPRRLHGRFLQITDMHPDPHYTARASQSTSCHRKSPKKENERAGHYGTPFSDCDSPLRFTNFTLDFLEKNWASEVDFVIWTGDNARHDNDRKLPRTPAEIYDLNRAVAFKMDKVFSSKGIPVIPSLGNNDVWPHNILTAGPNSITNEFSSIWKKFIPFPYHQVFQRGAYYSVEVIPEEVAVISLNTMYFYDSNKAVGGCRFTDLDDPGNLQLDWLEVQLKTFRQRDMQVWISGHVPPSPGNYFPECYVRYVELSLRFQDTVLGHIFGHMNADHFSFVEAVDLELVHDNETGIEPNPGVYIDLYATLLTEFAALPKRSEDVELDNYAVINVSPPLVPNPYKPTFRIFSYNVSAPDLSVDRVASKKMKMTVGKKRKHGHRRGKHGNKESQCKLEPYRTSWKCHLNESWYSDPDSPSRTNKQWTPLGYAQYYIPHLEAANKTHRPRFKLEYVTFVPENLHPPPRHIDDTRHRDFRYPIPLRHLPRVLRNPNVTESKYTPYEMRDLTIPSWVTLARRMADPKHEKLRKRFRKYMYLGGEEG